MKRLRVDIAQLATWDNLNLALWKAARGKRQRADVIRFLNDYEVNLTALRQQILQGRLPLDRYRCFRIKDPKPRKIVAVSFELRVLHHAIMNRIGASLERSQIHTSYACLPKRGVHAAAQQVQKKLRRAQWYVKIDIEKYFEHIDHQRLKAKLARRFKGQAFLSLLTAMIESFEDAPDQGLPIGSLTSQYFANFYLEQTDRFILQLPEVKGYIRYMDDMIWFCDSKAAAKASLTQVVEYLQDERLTVKLQRQIQPCSHGVLYCGFRILPHQILLSRRKKRSYRDHLQRWQSKWQNGKIDALSLQRGYDAVHAITWPARSLGFRRSVLAKTAVIEA